MMEAMVGWHVLAGYFRLWLSPSRVLLLVRAPSSASGFASVSPGFSRPDSHANARLRGAVCFLAWGHVLGSATRTKID